MTVDRREPRDILAGPVDFVVEGAAGAALPGRPPVSVS